MKDFRSQSWPMPVSGLEKEYWSCLTNEYVLVHSCLECEHKHETPINTEKSTDVNDVVGVTRSNFEGAVIGQLWVLREKSLTFIINEKILRKLLFTMKNFEFFTVLLNASGIGISPSRVEPSSWRIIIICNARVPGRCEIEDLNKFFSSRCANGFIGSRSPFLNAIDRDGCIDASVARCMNALFYWFDQFRVYSR